jgi:Ca2+-binding RTX toxin-like protein
MAMAWYFGTRGNDTMRGGNNDDFFWGNAGNDTLYGGFGNDTFYGGAGEDFFFGESGNDTVNYSSATQAETSVFGWNGVYVNLADGLGGEISGDTLDHYSSIENVTGSNFNDGIGGDGNANIIRGLGGDDLIVGMGGGDTLVGGDGIDTVSYYGSNARVVVDLANNTASGGHATGDVISEFENLIGSEHNDILSGNNGANVIEGSSGADTINGRGGNDTIEGGTGNDRLTGGSGADTFVYHDWYDNGADVITDFNVDVDRIRLDTLGDAPGSFALTTVFDITTHTFDVTVHFGTDGRVTLDNIAAGDVGDIASRIDIV